MENDEPLTPDLNLSGLSSRRPSNKKASLYAWTTLQSIPEETIISPHILEFLEQTLEPIPSVPPKESFPSAGESGALIVLYHLLYMHLGRFQKEKTMNFSFIILSDF